MKSTYKIADLSGELHARKILTSNYIFMSFCAATFELISSGMFVSGNTVLDAKLLKMVKFRSMQVGHHGSSVSYSNEEELLALQEDPIAYNNEVIFPDNTICNSKFEVFGKAKPLAGSPECSVYRS